MKTFLLQYGVTGLISFLLHVAFFGGVSRLAEKEPPKRATILEFAVVEPPKPEPVPDPEPEPEPEPKPKKKPPPPKKKKPRKIVKPIKKKAPPAPNTEAGDEPIEKARPVFGLTLESTVAAGSGGNFNVRVGNTLMKDPEKEFTPPDEVKAYKPVPIHQLDTSPKLLKEVKVPYTPEARANEIEGTVQLNVEVLADGSVGEVSVLKGLGYGLDQASISALKQFKFKPATKGGVAVACVIQFKYTWFLEY